MDIRFVGKNLKVTEGMKEHISEKVQKFEKYDSRIVESHILLKKEKYLYIAEITLLSRNMRVYGEGSAKENVFAAIDVAYVKVEKQLKKFREKIKDHNKHGNHFGPALKAVSQSRGARKAQVQEVDEPKIIKTRDFESKPMSLEEASMQLELSRKTFLVFQNSSTQKINVLFKREDGHHGLIEPNF